MIQIQNAQETGDPQADAFRHSGFEQELCRSRLQTGYIDGWKDQGAYP